MAIETLIVLVSILVVSIVSAVAGIVTANSSDELTRGTNPSRVRGIYYSLNSALARGGDAHNTMCRHIAGLYEKSTGADMRRALPVFLRTKSGLKKIHMPLAPFNFEKQFKGYRYQFKVVPKIQQGALKILGYEFRERREPIPPKRFWDNRVACYKSIEADLYGADP